MARRDELISEIAREEARLASLQSEIDECVRHIAVLGKELESLPLESHPIPRNKDPIISEAPRNNSEKIALFRSLFRGREDLFPKRWENLKNGKSGYSPVCANEWDGDLCGKGKKTTNSGRRVSCGECRNRAFLPVSDEEIAKHLRGDQIMGVYPLLPDETCRFLAADFDGDSWHEDISAFVKACSDQNVPVAVERSRSGGGGHAWFFFSSPISAATARKFGCFLITETLSRRYQFPMESYDRLFPNQDTMPNGGFGNLIALPLQRDARDSGNSVFVDCNFRPWPDQWLFLHGLKRIESEDVRAITDKAERRGQILGVRMSDRVEDYCAKPWVQMPSSRPHKAEISEPLPHTVNAILCQRLFIEKAGLPSAILNRLKQLAAFHNPEFYKKQKMRLSTALTPRIIACAEDLPGQIALPRGCLSEAEALLGDHGVTLNIEDRREGGANVNFTFRGTLTSIQNQVVEALLRHDTGVFVAPPGIGKTVVGTYLVAARNTNTLILVHRKPLLEQWVSRLAEFLGIEPDEIGRIGAGKRTANGKLDVAMVQSLVRKGEVSGIVAGYGQVILDEAHHCPAVSFERVLAEARARYVVGLTATPHRRDGHHPILRMQLGPVRYVIDVKSKAGRSPFRHRLFIRETGFLQSNLPEGAGIQELYASLAADRLRNDLIFDDVVRALEEKRSPILLTERRDHLEHFADRLRNFTRNLVVLHGRMKPKERREILERLATIPDGEERLLIATGRYIGEGFDDARLDTLFLALPVSWKGTLVQYAGRLNRLHPDKKELRVYDYADSGVPVLRKMFERRLRGYRAIGYAPDETLPSSQFTGDKTVVEYDEEELRTHDEKDM